MLMMWQNSVNDWQVILHGGLIEASSLCKVLFRVHSLGAVLRWGRVAIALQTSAVTPNVT